MLLKSLARQLLRIPSGFPHTQQANYAWIALAPQQLLHLLETVTAVQTRQALLKAGQAYSKP